MAEVNTVLHSDLKTPDTLVTFHNFQKIQILLFNSSTEDILHPTNFDLATLDILDELTDIFQLNVTLDVHQRLELNLAQEINFTPYIEILSHLKRPKTTPRFLPATTTTV